MGLLRRARLASGRLPVELRSSISAEELLVLAEGLPGSVTCRHYRAPGQYASWRKDPAAGTIAVTDRRLVVWAGQVQAHRRAARSPAAGRDRGHRRPGGPHLLRLRRGGCQPRPVRAGGGPAADRAGRRHRRPARPAGGRVRLTRAGRGAHPRRRTPGPSFPLPRTVPQFPPEPAGPHRVVGPHHSRRTRWSGRRRGGVADLTVCHGMPRGG